MAPPDDCLSAVDALGAVDVDLDAIFTALADPRRRYVVVCLDEQSIPSTLRDLAIRVAALEAGVPVADVPPEAIEPTYLELLHHHVPLLEAANVVDYDPARERVTLGASGDEPAVSLALARLAGIDDGV